MEGTHLSTDNPISVDFKKCIICQAQGDVILVSTANGRKRITDTSKIRDDIVAK